MSTAQLRLIRPVTLTDAMISSSNVAETDATEWLVGTAFTAGQTCQVTTTANGASVASNKIYTAVINNTGNDPTLDSGTNWTELSSTNRWKAFDQAYQTQTTNADSIQWVIASGEIVNHIALLNTEGATATILQATSGYTETKNLIRHDVLSWYDWFYDTPIATGDVIFTDIPPSAANAITVTITYTGATARCGVCVLGRAKNIGATQWGLSRSINDYSQTSESASGNVTLVQGGYSKRMNVEFKVTDGLESEVTRVLEQYRATPLVFVGSTEYSMTIIYGYLGAWSIPIALDGRSANMEIKGLI